MSHVATIDLEIKDLECLKKAAKVLGLEFRENQKTYKWFGTHVGDYPLPTGFSKEELGTCDHALSIINPESGSRAYEVGISQRRDGKPGYTLLWDFWAGGYGLKEKIGENGIELKKEYSAQVAEKHLRKQGFRPIRKVEGNRILIQGVR